MVDQKGTVMHTITLENRELVAVVSPADHVDYKYHTTGVVYIFQDGSDMWSADPMTASELQIHKAMVDAMADDFYYDEQDVEPFYTLGEPSLRW